MTHVLASATTPEAIQCGRLKHSWLENQILNKTPEKVVRLRRTLGWPALAHFLGNASEAITLANQVEFGFSPARLVDESGPLARLAKPDCKAIREAVHLAYLKQFDAEKNGREIRIRAERIRSTLDTTLEEWRKPDDVVLDSVLKAQWCAVLEAAVSLRDALDALPKAIVLP
jgi:hypothetical protein